MKRFTNYTAFKAAVAAAGLSIRIDPPSHEGMHEDDAYEPVFAINDAGDEFGMFNNVEDGSVLGVLFENAGALAHWLHSEEDA